MHLHVPEVLHVVRVDNLARGRLGVVENVCSQNMDSLAFGCEKRVTLKNLGEVKFQEILP